MKIVQALPRRMRFEARRASSVELCVAEWVSGSRYREQTTVFAEKSDAVPLAALNIFRLDEARHLSSWHLAKSIREQVRAKGYDLIITQQHIATAARIAFFNRRTPVVLQTHNFIDPPVQGRFATIRNWLRQLELRSLAGITLVSEATRAQFEKDWPGVRIPRAVVSNGFNFAEWRLDRARTKTVIVVGRMHETKGILEAAEGVEPFLQKFPDWRAIFILSDVTGNPGYFEKIKARLASVGSRAEILTGIPFARVKELSEEAEISLVPSKWLEPFGRTALEAHAGGAALVSSGTGGLREISGDNALFLPETTGPAIADALARLASDDTLRRSLAEAGAAYVRARFSLVPASQGSEPGSQSICEKLDAFLDRVAGAGRSRGTAEKSEVATA